MPATPPETDVLEHEVRIAARPETVFAYFTDPIRMVQWMGAEATLDPRPGGVFRIVFKPSQPAADFAAASLGLSREEAQGPNVVMGEFAEVDPYTRVAFTWGYESGLLAMPPQSTAVDVSLTPDGEATIVRLVHRRLPAGAAPFHRAGWDHFLPRLVIAASGGDPGPDPLQVAAKAP